jgi:hypothetical protein
MPQPRTPAAGSGTGGCRPSSCLQRRRDRHRSQAAGIGPAVIAQEGRVGGILKFFGSVIGIVFLIGLIVVIGLLMLIF